MRRAGVEVGVSLGGAGTRRWGEVGVCDLDTWVEEAESEGAGVRGGGGEQVIGVVTGGAGLSRSRGFGVRRGGEGVTEGGAGAEEDEDVGAGSEGGEVCVPLEESFASGWL